MSDEPSRKTKADVLDLLISFLREHEKQMDYILQRLERIVETLVNNGRLIEPPSASQPPEELHRRHFNLAITNPEHFEDIRTLNIEWGRRREIITNNSQAGTRRRG